MRRTIIALTLSIYIAFSFLLFFQISQMDHNNMKSPCALPQIIGLDCPGNATNIAMLAHHISSITDMLKAVIPVTTLLVVLLVFFEIYFRKLYESSGKFKFRQKLYCTIQSMLWRVTSYKEKVKWLMRKNKLEIVFAFHGCN